MKLYVNKNPCPGTMSKVVQVDDDAAAPDAPWILMTVDDYNNWVAEQVAAAPKRQLTDTVLQRLTSAERSALFAARQTSPDIDYFITRAAAATAIRSDDPDFPAAKNALDEAGIISRSRWDELLSP